MYPSREFYTSREVYEHIAMTNKDPIVERRTCRVSGTQFPIFQSDLDFFQKVSPVVGGKQFVIPLPTLCPEERQRRRLSFRNERNLYRRVCDASGRDVISVYSPDKKFLVYDQKYRRSDARNPLIYGQVYDKEKSFFSQFGQLFAAVPKDALIKEFVSQENSDYTNSAGRSKNCYMAFEMGDCEDVYFSEHIFFSKNCIDVSHSSNNEQCYECVDCYDSYVLMYSAACSNCKYSSFLYNCNNCEYCFMSGNLVNAQYYIYNKKYNSKLEYEQALAQILTPTPDLYKEFKELVQSDRFVRPAMQGVNNEFVLGANTTKSTNAIMVTDSFNIKDCKYCSIINTSQDCMDYDSWGEQTSLVYEIEECGRNMMNCMSCINCYSNISYLYYCHSCMNCSYCFGCVGLRDKQYCILNTQYTKEEYEKKLSDIIECMTQTGERGEFFHSSLSPFGYNETVAMEYYPCDSEDSQSHDLSPNFTNFGYKRSDYQSPTPFASRIVPASDLPADSTQVSDDIISAAIACEVSGKPFRILKQELEFYRMHRLPVPRRHPNIRYSDRLKLRVPRELHVRTCDKTGQSMISTYSSLVPYKVYSQEAYQQEVYS